jgi:hypothetical protein
MKQENTDNITEIYKTFLQQEIANNTIFITVLLGIVVILLGATWWWNKSGANKEIKEEVEKRFEKEKKKLIKQFEELLNEKLIEKIKDYENKVLQIESDVARSMAISATSDKAYSYSIYWLSKYLKCSLDLNNETGIRNGTSWILEDLKLLMESDENKDKKTIYQCHFVEETVSKLPELLEKEKKEILKFCKGRKVKE